MVDPSNPNTELFTPYVLSWSLLIGGIVFGILLLAELLHLRRNLSVSGLVFGPNKGPSPWVFIAPVIRTVATTTLAACLTMLALFPPISHSKNSGEIAFEKLKHVILVLDVSPSMRLQDAGDDGDQSRMARAREVMESYFQRIPMAEYRVTVIAVYTEAYPVVEQTKDAAVVRNILNDLPMHFAFVPGDTDLFAGIKKAAEVARGLRPRSASVLMITDGDTVPATGMPKMPAAVADVVIIGVGDAAKGSFINGKNSRQDVSTLRQIATRLRGVYHNGNEKHLSTALIERLTAEMEGEEESQLSARDWARFFAAISVLALALLPIVLHYMGTMWLPGIRRAASTT